MKKIIFSVAVLVGTVAIAQTGRVGVNTSAPVRTLDVEGNLRVKTVTDQSAVAAYSNILIQNPTTGFVDATPEAALAEKLNKLVEPWQVAGAVGSGAVAAEKAKANNQNIYQQANVSVGSGVTHTVPFTTFRARGSRSEFGLFNSDPTIVGDRRSVILEYTGGNGPIGMLMGFNVNREGVTPGANNATAGRYLTSLNNSLGALTPNTGAMFYDLQAGKWQFTGITKADASVREDFLVDDNTALTIDHKNKRIGVGPAAVAPSQALDVDGNGRIRGLVDGSAFPNVVMADANGVLGKTTAASISSSAEPWYNSATKTQATGNSQKIYQRNSVSIGDIYNTVNPVGEGLNINIGTSASGINPSNYAKGWIITHNAIPGGYLENTGGPAGQRVMKDWMEVNTPTASTARNTYNWQRVSDNVQSSTGTILKVDMSNGFVGLGQYINNGTSDQVVPSQQLDVIGNARIRALADGSAFPNIVVADANGVLGKKNLSVAPTDVSDSSNALMVHKLYSAGDFPSGGGGKNTGFSVSNWDAFLTITKIQRNGVDGGNSALLGLDGGSLDLRIQSNGTNWIILGDVSNMVEGWEFEVLYVKKGLVARDNTRQAL